MLKHVQISPLRQRADSVSLRSSISCASSLCGSPEPPPSCGGELQRTPSRASSYSSLNEHLPQTTIKVFTNCLKIDIEYKTLGIQWDTTSKEVITQLLRRLKMRHRDPRLFYLSMEVLVRRAGVKTILVLDDDTRPAILQACHPKGESRFCLQLKPGGLIRVHTSALQPSSQYKALIISEETTSDELLQLLLSCYNSIEPVEQFSIYEVCPGQEYQRKLHPDDIPLRAQAERIKRGETCHFLVRRNPIYARRRQLLNSLNEVMQTYGSSATTTNNNNNSANTSNNNNMDNANNNNSSSNNNNQHHHPSSCSGGNAYDGNSSINSLDDATSLLDASIADDLHSLLTLTSDEDDIDVDVDGDGDVDVDCASSTSGSSDTSSEGSITVRRTPSSVLALSSTSINGNNNNNNNTIGSSSGSSGGSKIFRTTATCCSKCRNNFKSCEFCHKNVTLMQQQQQQQQPQQRMQLATYNPVYNIREIRTATHSFSSLGADKKLLDIQLNARFEHAALSALTAATAVLPAVERVVPCRTPRPHSVYVARSPRMYNEVTHLNRAEVAACNANGNNNNTTKPTAKHTATAATATTTMAATSPATTTTVATAPVATTTTTLSGEMVNNNPARGLGHFVYL